ncbi:alpha/beta fold hydrolase [Synechococcus sp. CBW1002]|uniref:esterase/lipase family protein n=1 Tax=Synechococcus sp. CBW1002 TaxID=1353134 RepID=UPI0018CF4E72|nr:alpha/beta fold hydrolase [Synechococcus sp. CBW1002]QPN59366.1 alpha/beta fold hydrolase [Synechococcus sp. CBW1002]
MSPPLVLVHGLWDTPRLFRHLEAALAGGRSERLVPHLPHRCGHTSLTVLAERLGERIETTYGADLPIDLLGFSMGGVIARLWLQGLGGYRRTRRFFSLGSPQQGSLLALPWPQALMPGLAQMKPGSPLLRQLNDDVSTLKAVECHSLFCRWDLMVVPGWTAVLPVGTRQELPVWTHRQLLTDPAALTPLTALLLQE